MIQYLVRTPNSCSKTLAQSTKLDGCHCYAYTHLNRTPSAISATLPSHENSTKEQRQNHVSLFHESRSSRSVEIAPPHIDPDQRGPRRAASLRVSLVNDALSPIWVCGHLPRGFLVCEAGLSGG